MYSRKPFPANRQPVRAILLALLTLASGLLPCPAQAQDKAAGVPSSFKNEREKAGYAFGMNLGLGWKKEGVDMDADAIARGLKDVQAGGPTLLTATEITQTLNKLARDVRLIQRQRRDQTAETNRSQGTTFLEHNQTSAGVVTLPSGLQYKVIAKGAGESPVLTNWVSLKVRGTRINGAEFETSYGYPEPNSYSLGSVIPAWAEALQQMKPGAEWQLFVPPNLAFGKDGSHTVGPNETLIYDLTLVSVFTGPAKDIRTAQAPDQD